MLSREKLRIKFLNFCFSNDYAVELWSKLRVVIDIFQGDPGKFSSTFFGLMSDNLLPNHFNHASGALRHSVM